MLFDFDKYFVREEAKPGLRSRSPQVMIADTQTQFLVDGHHRHGRLARVQSGPVRASRQCRGRLPRRAGRVPRPHDRAGFGKTQLAVQTPPNTPEPAEPSRRDPSPLSDASRDCFGGGRGLRAAPFRFYLGVHATPAARGSRTTGRARARADAGCHSITGIAEAPCPRVSRRDFTPTFRLSRARGQCG